MFWKFELQSGSQLEKLLERDDVTLRELLDEEDVLQECKAQNHRLLLFLTRDASMLELLHLITQQPPTDQEEKLRFKYANMACELLTCDVSVINDKLGGDESLLNILYNFLEQAPPLNPLLASFVSKTIGNLISHKTQQVLSFVRSKEDFIGLVLKHIDASAMMDLLLRLISCVEPAPVRQDMLTWLNEEKLIQRLTALIQPHTDTERQSNASQALCDIIRLSRDQTNQMPLEISQPDPLLALLESQDTVDSLLRNMFEGEKSEVCIVNGTQVLLTLLETRRPGNEVVGSCCQGCEKSHDGKSNVSLGIKPHLYHYHQLLLYPPKKCPMLTTLGVLEEPLGNARLHAARLITMLLQTSAPSISQELCRLDILNLLLDLFFKYVWNNFLHSQVEQCVSTVLKLPAPEGRAQSGPVQTKPEDSHTHCQNSVETSKSKASLPDTCMCVSVLKLFQDCHLIQRILQAWEENSNIQAEGGMRRGYMGHLTGIANAVVQAVERGPLRSQITRLIEELPEECRGRWENFVNNTLTETNKTNTVDLSFSDYQVQQMTANFVDQFGFNDEEFPDHDDSINATFDRISEINFSLNDNSVSAGTVLYESCCSERIQQFNDAEDEEDIWEDKEVNYATQVKARTRFGVWRVNENGTGSHDPNRRLQLPEIKGHTESINTQEPKQASSPQSPGWKASFEDGGVSCVAVDTGSSVWGDVSSPLGDSEEKGWATFTDFQPFCCSDSGPRCSSPPLDSQSQTKQDKNLKSSSACVWSVCVARTAPLVASDGSSSSSSDSEEEEEERKSDIITMETSSTESNQLPSDTKNEKTASSSEANAIVSDSIATDTKATVTIGDIPPTKEQRSESDTAP
ncbi:serine/threonine-protein phosphatase 6 regulatory subunit 2 [Chanos chanos]|uniref:Serine/threonine-protein phosphatase 6 regulatory subunit 2 n=1 Tax=Chanos chanos TaxID=29144 RepID=A0A6J2WQ48_CHACN|nr:serine/threonine-protein phosphatase 6 regulatory subunit 2-like [Chanos chanos]